MDVTCHSRIRTEIVQFLLVRYYEAQRIAGKSAVRSTVEAKRHDHALVEKQDCVVRAVVVFSSTLTTTFFFVSFSLSTVRDRC